MEVLRRTQYGQSLASIIEFKAVNYVFGKNKIKEHPWNARNRLERYRMLSSQGAEFFGTRKSLVQVSNTTLPWIQTSRNNYLREQGYLTQENKWKWRSASEFQVHKSKVIIQVDEKHLSETEGTIHSNDTHEHLH